MTIYLSTRCAVLGCGHAYNWHTASGCAVETCRCRAFAIPGDDDRRTYLELEVAGRLSADDLWDATGYARCQDCGHVMRTTTLVSLPEHGCSRRQTCPR